MKALFLVIILCLLLSFAFVLTVTDASNWVVRFDEDTSETFRVNASPTVTTIFDWITRLGGNVLWPVSLATGAVLLLKRRFGDLATGIVAVGGGKLLNLALKGSFDRPRPEWGGQVAGAIESFAFPSGHAMMGLLVNGYLAVMLWRSLPTRKMQLLLAAGTVVLVGLIGLSRVVIGRHYPSDVFAGYSMAGAWLSLCLAGRMLVEDMRRVRAQRSYPVRRQEEEIVYETNRSVDQRR